MWKKRKNVTCVKRFIQAVLRWSFTYSQNIWTWHFLASIASKDFIPKPVDKYTSNRCIFMRKVNVLNVERSTTITLLWESTELKPISWLKKKKVFTSNCKLFNLQAVKTMFSQWNCRHQSNKPRLIFNSALSGTKIVGSTFKRGYHCPLSKAFNQCKTWFKLKPLSSWNDDSFPPLCETRIVVARLSLYYPTRILSGPRRAGKLKSGEVIAASSSIYRILTIHNFKVFPKYKSPTCLAIKNWCIGLFYSEIVTGLSHHGLFH